MYTRIFQVKRGINGAVIVNTICLGVNLIYSVFTLRINTDNNHKLAINASRVVFDFSSNFHFMHSTQHTHRFCISSASGHFPSVHVYILSDCKKNRSSNRNSLHTMVGADPSQLTHGGLLVALSLRTWALWRLVLILRSLHSSSPTNLLPLSHFRPAGNGLKTYWWSR